jgi:hypothetical protein
VVFLRKEITVDRQEKLADKNRHVNRWAQAQMSPPNYQPMMLGAVHARSTLRPNNPREENAEDEDAAD